MEWHEFHLKFEIRYIFTSLSLSLVLISLLTFPLSLSPLSLLLFPSSFFSPSLPSISDISLSLYRSNFNFTHTILIQNWMLYFIASYEENSSPQSTGSILLARRVTQAKASWGQCNYLACVRSTTFHHLSSLFTKMLWSQKSTYCLIKDISGNPVRHFIFPSCWKH